MQVLRCLAKPLKHMLATIPHLKPCEPSLHLFSFHRVRPQVIVHEELRSAAPGILDVIPPDRRAIASIDPRSGCGSMNVKKSARRGEGRGKYIGVISWDNASPTSMGVRFYGADTVEAA